MEDTQSVAILIESASSKIQQLQQAFTELESHRAVTLNLKWKELEAHFHGLEKSLKRRFHDLEDQEKDYESKAMEAQGILEKRQAALVAKEQACLNKLQEKRDAAAFAISKAREKHRKVSPMKFSAATNAYNGGAVVVEEESLDSNISEELKASENGNADVISCPQLVKLCQAMDSDGLHNFISDNRKNLASIREDIPLALKASPDPAGFVLDSLKSFYRGDLTSLDAKKDSGLLGMRRTCVMLLECLSILLMSLDSLSVSKILSEKAKARAMAIAAEWKPKLGELELDMSNGNSLEAHAFLQLLDTFCIASDFDVEELSELVPMVSRRRQAADLCRSLGLADKMPGVIEVLINSGKHIDAVNLAFAFELTEQFSPIALLKSYLKDAKEIVSPKAGNGSPSSPSAQVEVSERELTSLRAVIKCVEEHKLEQEYPLDVLQKRIIQLEKAKAEKKRATEVAKPHSKRPRASNNTGSGPRIANNTGSPPYAVGPAERYPPPQYMYERPYVYPTEAHCTHLVGPTAYHLPPAHHNYFGNGYQYHHQAAYLH
ncbi:hypothetical protein V2J09_022070 [Rumex salicifolius]